MRRSIQSGPPDSDATIFSRELGTQFAGRPHQTADELRRQALARTGTEQARAADNLEADWNEKLRVLAKARDERERARRGDRLVIDDTVRERLVAMTTDFKRLWSDRSTPNRERKRMLAHVIEDATLVKISCEGTTKVHVRFKGGQTTTLTTANPKASWQKVKTSPELVKLVDKLLDDHLYDGIAEILNARGLRPGGSAWPGKSGARFTAQRVQYIVHAYGLRLRYDRLRARGLLTKPELAARLGIHEATLTSWVKHGIVKSHAYNGHACLYEEPPNRPTKHCSRWDRLTDRAKVMQNSPSKNQGPQTRSNRGVV